ncbi:MAG: hypothetical protein SGPRY_010781 [Prymnesium sp.]
MDGSKAEEEFRDACEKAQVLIVVVIPDASPKQNMPITGGRLAKAMTSAETSADKCSRLAFDRWRTRVNEPNGNRIELTRGLTEDLVTCISGNLGHFKLPGLPDAELLNDLVCAPACKELVEEELAAFEGAVELMVASLRPQGSVSPERSSPSCSTCPTGAVLGPRTTAEGCDAELRHPLLQESFTPESPRICSLLPKFARLLCCCRWQMFWKEVAAFETRVPAPDVAQVLTPLTSSTERLLSSFVVILLLGVLVGALLQRWWASRRTSNSRNDLLSEPDHFHLCRAVMRVALIHVDGTMIQCGSAGLVSSTGYLVTCAHLFIRPRNAQEDDGDQLWYGFRKEDIRIVLGVYEASDQPTKWAYIADLVTPIDYLRQYDEKGWLVDLAVLHIVGEVLKMHPPSFVGKDRKYRLEKTSSELIWPLPRPLELAKRRVTVGEEVTLPQYPSPHHSKPVAAGGPDSQQVTICIDRDIIQPARKPTNGSIISSVRQLFISATSSTYSPFRGQQHAQQLTQEGILKTRLFAHDGSSGAPLLNSKFELAAILIRSDPPAKGWGVGRLESLPESCYFSFCRELYNQPLVRLGFPHGLSPPFQYYQPEDCTWRGFEKHLRSHELVKAANWPVRRGFFPDDLRKSAAMWVFQTPPDLVSVPTFGQSHHVLHVVERLLNRAMKVLRTDNDDEHALAAAREGVMSASRIFIPADGALFNILSQPHVEKQSEAMPNREEVAVRDRRAKDCRQLEFKEVWDKLRATYNATLVLFNEAEEMAPTCVHTQVLIRNVRNQIQFARLKRNTWPPEDRLAHLDEPMRILEGLNAKLTEITTRSNTLTDKEVSLGDVDVCLGVTYQLIAHCKLEMAWALLDLLKKQAEVAAKDAAAGVTTKDRRFNVCSDEMSYYLDRSIDIFRACNNPKGLGYNYELLEQHYQLKAEASLCNNDSEHAMTYRRLAAERLVTCAHLEHMTSADKARYFQRAAQAFEAVHEPDMARKYAECARANMDNTEIPGYGMQGVIATTCFQ